MLCRVVGQHLADDPHDVPLLGSSLAMLLDAAMDSGGDIAHLETGCLGQLPLFT